MTLLVVGLVAVIVVILIAVFLSTRTGRGDEHEDVRTRPSDRDRRRGEGERGRDARERDRGPASGRGGPNRHAVGRELVPAYADGRRRERPAARSRDYDELQRGPRRHDPDARPAGYGSPPRRAIAAPARAEGRSRSSEGRGRPQAPPRLATDDFPSADHPSSMDVPAEDFPVAEPPATEFAAGRATARTKSLAGRDADNAGRDADNAARRKPARGGHGDGGSKGRSKPLRGRHDDDDDWPSTEWDKLSDEQYWAELSADKPVASLNPPTPGNRPAPAPEKSAAAKSLPVRAAKPDSAPAGSRPAQPLQPGKPLQPAASAGREMSRDLPSRKERAAAREAVTERLPVRPRPQRAAIEAPRPARPAPAAPPTPAPLAAAPLAAAAGPAPASPRDSGDQGLAMLADLGTSTVTPPSVRDDDPLTSPSFSRKAVSATDSRSYSNARNNGPGNNSLTGLDRKSGSGGGRHRAAPPPDEEAAAIPLAAPPAAAAQHASGPYPTAPARHGGNGYAAGQHPSGPYPAVPAQHSGADYPAAQHPSGPYPTAPARHGGNGYSGHQHPSGPYPVSTHPGGYAQDIGAPTASPGSWYNTPAESASLPGHENPGYAGAGAARATAGAAGAGGYNGGPSHPPAAYRGPSYADPGGAGSHQLPMRAGRGEPAEAISHPSFPGGQPGQQPYWDANHSPAPYPAGYADLEYGDDHGAEPYQADGYGGYAAQA